MPRLTNGAISPTYKKALEKRHDIRFTKFEQSKHPVYSCFFTFIYPASSKGLQTEIHGHALKNQYINQAVAGFFYRRKDFQMKLEIAWAEEQAKKLK